MRSPIPVLTALALTLTGLAGRAPAQTTGRIAGQVLDSSQAVVPAAEVTVVNQANALKRTAAADQQGRYAVADLPVGLYSVSAGARGFKTQVRAGVMVNVATAVTADFILSPGEVTETVQVTERLRDVETVSSSGRMMDNGQLMGLPINGRDYARFSLLAPGAVARTNQLADLTFNGLHTIHNQFSIDGVDATRVDAPYMANGYERGARLLTGSLETIAEFRVQTGNYKAEYGRAAAAFVAIATRSGGNDTHGVLFDFFRNSALDARNYFNNSGDKAPFRYNNFGGNLGGALRKDRTFYFANYEGSRQRIGVTGSGTVPSALLREKVIATSPVLKPVVEMFPLGTSSTADPLVDLYTTARSSRVREDTGSVRIDHHLSDSDRLFGRVNINDSRVYGPLFLVSAQASALGTLDFQDVPGRIANIALNHQHTFSPRLLNEFLAGAQRITGQTNSDVPFPRFNVTGLTAQPGTRGRTFLINGSYQVGNGTTWVNGAHTLKWGGTLYWVRMWRRSANSQVISYTSLDNFVNNRAASATLTAGYDRIANDALMFGAYVQDTWQVRPRLTLDYGLRYDLNPAPWDVDGKAQPYDPRTSQLAAPGAAFFATNYRNFAPRFALSWQPASRLLVRTGYGIFYGLFPASNGVSLSRNTMPGNTSMVRQQIPDLSYPIEPFLTRGTSPLPSAAGFPWNSPDLYAQHWNLTLVFQVSESDSVSAAYVANRGINLGRSINVNFFDPALGRRPVAAFTDISVRYADGQSVFHALQLSWKRRMARGLQSEFYYSFGKVLDDVGDAGLGSSQPQDNRNYRAERGPGAGDVRNNVSYVVLYELPIGKGHRLAGTAPGAAGVLLSGWKVSSLGILRSGIAKTVNIGVNTFGNGNLSNQRPDAVAGVSPYAAVQRPEGWLNAAAYTMPLTGTFGNLGRNTIRGPDFQQIDFSVLKETRLTERTRSEFRVEFFNLFNRPNFDFPNVTFATSSFGRILNTVGRTMGMGTSRQVQIAMKVTF